MRRAFNSSLWKEKDSVVAINLGADYCSEHEWGIDKIKTIMGISTEQPLGLESRKITKNPSEGNEWQPKIYFKKQGSQAVLALTDGELKGIASVAKDKGDIWTKAIKNGEYACSWDSGSFLIYSKNKEVSNFLKELHQAFINKDVVCFVGSGGPFQNGGLILGIYSLIPEGFKKETKESDLDRKKLLDLVDKTGIKEDLKNAGKGYYALEPRWASQEQKSKSSYDIVFWLNPTNQKENNHGWFSVEELQLWINNKGPIPKVLTKVC